MRQDKADRILRRLRTRRAKLVAKRHKVEELKEWERLNAKINLIQVQITTVMQQIRGERR